jgi:hypothetical protein
MPPVDSPLAACLALLAGWALVGVAGLLRPASIAFVGRVLFPLGALTSVALAIVAGCAGSSPERLTDPPATPAARGAQSPVEASLPAPRRTLSAFTPAGRPS